ncbi:MAG: hypothetical protein SPI34_01665 [Opitutales bacterium]|nr:hypothetical protein [Opitutales bacterium]
MPPYQIECLQKGVECGMATERVNAFRAVAATISNDYARKLTQD